MQRASMKFPARPARIHKLSNKLRRTELTWTTRSVSYFTFSCEACSRDKQFATKLLTLLLVSLLRTDVFVWDSRISKPQSTATVNMSRCGAFCGNGRKIRCLISSTTCLQSSSWLRKFPPNKTIQINRVSSRIRQENFTNR